MIAWSGADESWNERLSRPSLLVAVFATTLGFLLALLFLLLFRELRRRKRTRPLRMRASPWDEILHQLTVTFTHLH